MADMNGAGEAEVIGQLDHVGDVGVHVVADVGLGRAAMTAAIMRDYPETMIEKKQHLSVPVIRAQRPAMMKEDRLRVLWSPVLVEDLRLIAGGEEGHLMVSGMMGMVRGGDACRRGKQARACDATEELTAPECGQCREEIGRGHDLASRRAMASSVDHSALASQRKLSRAAA